jgi:hypothetical protein
MADYECAVWYMRYGTAYYELWISEAQAVSYAYSLADSEEGAVLGVQFADGRLIKREDWQALAEHEQERMRALYAQPSTPRPPPRRPTRDPFDGHQAHVDADDPGWLGA